MERGEDQITSPNDLALLLLDSPLPEGFPVIHLAGREWQGLGAVPALLPRAAHVLGAAWHRPPEL